MRAQFVFPDGKMKALTLSYDDGVLQDRRLIEIFNRYKIKGTFHLNSGLSDWDSRISADEIAETYREHEISCHSATHPFLERISREEAIEEVMSDRRNLEKLAGYPVIGMSYPYGTYDSEVIAMLRSLGIVYSRTIRSTGHFSLPDNFLEWHPTCHHKDKLLERAEAFKKCVYPMALFYVWGHSYEFDSDNNWNLMEEFCEKISGDPNIWYATNIEIYGYITALRRLEFSADRKIVRNTNGIPVWLKTDKIIKVMPGELMRLT